MAIITATELEQYLGATLSGNYTDGQLATAAAVASSAVERYCDRTFEATDYRKWMDGSGTDSLWLEHYPIIKIMQVSCDWEYVGYLSNSSSDSNGISASMAEDGKLWLTVAGGTNAGSSSLTLSSYSTLAALATAVAALSKGWTLTVSEESDPQAMRPFSTSAVYTGSIYISGPGAWADCVPDGDSGRLVSSCWRRGTKNVYVHYRAGYEAVPEDVQAAACGIARDYLMTHDADGSVTSERLGDYQYQRAAATGIADTYSRLLAPYVRRGYR